MSFVKIRGNQIQDNQLKNQHIAADAAIDESKLNIDWTTRSSDISSSVKGDFASTTTGKGASLIGIEDAGAKFIATTVEGALAELKTDVAAAGSSTTLEVEAARKATALTGIEVIHTDLDARLEASETVVKSTNDEVTTARGTAVNLDARLSRALNADGSLKNGTKIHEHMRYIHEATGGETTVMLPGANTFTRNGTLDVYVNGLMQAEGIHYMEMTNEFFEGIGVDFMGEALVAGDIVILKWQYNQIE